MSGDKVSIVVPVYNAENYITETVNSVLSQSYENWELLLVENGSSDNSHAVLEELQKKDERIHVIDMNSNVGAAKARNAGTNAATGKYLAFLDADDLWRSEKLEHEIAFLKEHEAVFVFTGYEFGDENAKPTGKIVHVPATMNHKQAMKNTTIFTSTVMFDLSVLGKEKLMMPVIKSEDTALWWSVLKDGHTAYGLNENLVIYRRPAKSLSSNKVEALRRIWNLYRKWEKLNFFTSCWYFVNWAVRAVFRRI